MNCILTPEFKIAEFFSNCLKTSNIRAEGIRILKAEGSAVSAVGGVVSPQLGRKSKFGHIPMITEAQTVLGTPSQCG